MKIIEVDERVFQIPDYEDYGDYKMQIETLYLIINQLDEYDKAVLILYLEEKSYREIAEILGITESNVGTKINRIKMKLKESFKRRGE